MSITIQISRETETRLKEKATAAGVDVETYAARYLELLAAPRRSLKELSGPIAKAFAASGMSEDELAELLEEEKHAVRAQRRAQMM